MKKIFYAIGIAFLGLAGLRLTALNGQDAPEPAHREIAVTFDDLPRNGPDTGLANTQAMTDRLTATIQAHHIPVVGMVNESQLYRLGELEARVALLNMWLDRGAELGNHTFTHSSLQTMPLNNFEDDLIRGENVTRMLLAKRGMKLRYFRYPFLATGPTLEVKEQFEKFLADHHYINAPVTIETSDWMFSAIYTKAKLEGNQALADKIAGAYLEYSEKQFSFFEKFSTEVAGYEPRQVLLLHANWLNADHFEEVVDLMKRHGYTFVTLERALEDKAYSLPDNYAGPVGYSWIERWAISKGMKSRLKEEPDPPEEYQKMFRDLSKSK